MLGPLLFIVYMADVTSVACKHNVTFTDDTHACLSLVSDCSVHRRKDHGIALEFRAVIYDTALTAQQAAVYLLLHFIHLLEYIA